MDVKSYRAKTLREALHLVQQDLGPEAAVLNTRQVWDGMFRGLFGRRQVEVTASNSVSVPSRFAHHTTNDTLTDTGWELSTASAPPNPASTDSASHVSSPSGNQFSMAEQASHPDPTSDPLPRENWGDWLPNRLPNRDSFAESVAPGSTSRNLPQSLFNLFTDLVDADVDEDLARELVARLKNVSAGLSNTQELRTRALELLQAEIPIQGPIEAATGMGRIVALVGPTGVGKTTTIAKLAANFRLREKRRVGLVTVDTYRIAAVEQLRTYADIIDLPMEVVSSPREMKDAIARLAHLDLILMDTAGRSPRDEIKIRELKTILAEARADEVHLVLSATAGATALTRTAARFADVGTTSLIVTKLDESTGLGNLLPLWRASQLPMSYVTNGQNVPDDIQVANACRLAKTILGFGS